MNNQLGEILYVGLDEFQKSIATPGLVQHFNEMHLTKQKDFMYLVESVFQNGSPNRSFFYMDMPFREYGAYVKGFDYYMPFYGVKGKTPGMRTLNYTELLTCKKEELEGVGFTDRVFGTNYMTAEQGIAASGDALIQVMQQDRFPVSHKMKKEEIADAIMVLEKLWEAQEADPRTRFIIRMNDPEHNSMDLLRRMYLLLPQGLRRQLGFETNIAAADIQLIHQNSGIPIYVLTAGQDAAIRTNQYDFPVVVFDYENRKSYSYNSKRMQILETTASEINDLNSVFLDYAEKKVMEDNKAKYSSFKFYEDIVERANDPKNYWWKNENVDSVESLKAQYDDQRQLLNNDELYQEAMYALLTKILPKSNLAPQLVKLLRDRNYPNRKELLDFLAQDLNQSTQINAMIQLKNEILTELKAAKEKEIATLKTQCLAEKDAAVEAVKAQKDDELEDIKRRAREEIENLQMMINKLQEAEKTGKDDKKSGRMAKDLANAKKTAKSMKIGCIVCGVVAAVAIVGAVVLGMGGSTAKKSLAESEQQVKTLTEQNNSLTKENETLSTEKEEALKAKEDAEKLAEARKKDLELLGNTSETGTGETTNENSSATDQTGTQNENQESAHNTEGETTPEGESAPTEDTHPQ